MNEQKQVNEGYTIIESMTVGQCRFVIGENLNNPAAPYVTWQANIKNDPDNFFWGHYCATKLGAVADFGGVSRRRPNFSVNGKNPKRRRYQSEVMNDEQT